MAAPKKTTPTILDWSAELPIEHFMADVSLACMDVTAAVGGEAAALLCADELHQPVAGRLAQLLEQSLLGERCLLNLGQCFAAFLLFSEIAETALPSAMRAGQLADFFRAKHDAES